MIERRMVLKLLAGTLLASALCAPVDLVFAKDGGDSGHDGGHDDHGQDDGGDDGDDGKGKKNNDGLDQDEVLREMEKGQIIPLKTALKIVDGKVSGKVIDIKLTRTLGRSQYRFKVRRDDGAITTIRLDAKTGSFVGILGF